MDQPMQLLQSLHLIKFSADALSEYGGHTEIP